jgi:diguanylate cyclase (GGDEF)-like protein
VVAALLTAAASTLSPRHGWWSTGFSVACGYLAVAAILAGARRLPRGRRLPWWILAFGVCCAASGAVPIELDLAAVTGGPDLADYLYLTFYPACALALTLMIKRVQRRVDWAALIDALTVTAGIGLFEWVYQMRPALESPDMPLGDRITVVAYPICDLVLLAMTILLVRSTGRGSGAAPRLIALAITGYLVGDWAWVVIGQLHPAWYEVLWVGRGIDGVYLISVAVMGLAVARPDIRDDGLGAAAVARLSPAQLIVLTIAVLIAPALLVAQVIEGEVRSGLSIAIGAATMFLLVVTRMAQLLRQAERTSWQIRELSRRDELTGLPNRRAWVDELPRVLEEARRDGLPVSIAMLDLDHFKAYNDRYGHPAGDRLLKSAAAAWHGVLRRSDMLARYGGEEFIVLLPGVDIGHAAATLERLKDVTPEGETFSAGVAAWDGAETSDDLIARTDEALYCAKGAGRDRVVAVLSA